MLNQIKRWILALLIYLVTLEMERINRALLDRPWHPDRDYLIASLRIARFERAALRDRHAATYPVGLRAWAVMRDKGFRRFE